MKTEYITEEHWLSILETIRREPDSTWQVRGDDEFVKEGRITHWPPGPPGEWSPGQAIYVGTEKIGDPILLRLVREIRRLG